MSEKGKQIKKLLQIAFVDEVIKEQTENSQFKINTMGISISHILVLNKLYEQYQCSLDIKRSGTGIVVLIGYE